MVKKPPLPLSINEIWFNGYQHLTQKKPHTETLGGPQGEKLTTFIHTHQLPWNITHFNGSAISVTQNEITLPGGMVLNILSPSSEQLAKLKPKWRREVIKAGLLPGFGDEAEKKKTTDKIESFGIKRSIPNVEKLFNEHFEEDKAEANGSSIALLAKFEGKQVLLAGDAHPSRILSSLNQLQPSGKIKLDLFKLSHHGSTGNTSPDLLAKIDCKRFVISSNGSIYEHPHAATVARILKINPTEKELIFNYSSPFTSMWNDPLLKKEYNYETSYPSSESQGFIGVTI